MSVVRLKKNSMTNDAAHNCVGIRLTSKTCYLLGPLWDRIILWTLEIWRMLICLHMARTFHLHHCSGQKTDVVMHHRPINLAAWFLMTYFPFRNGWTMASMGIWTIPILIWTQAWAISMKDWNGALFQWVSHDTSTQGLMLGLCAPSHSPTSIKQCISRVERALFWAWRENLSMLKIHRLMWAMWQPGYDQGNAPQDQHLFPMAFHNRWLRADSTLPPNNRDVMKRKVE